MLYVFLNLFRSQSAAFFPNAIINHDANFLFFIIKFLLLSKKSDYRHKKVKEDMSKLFICVIINLTTFVLSFLFLSLNDPLSFPVLPFLTCT